MCKQKDNTPLVSVIMGIYNCADTISEAIDSILAQTYTNWELIMCDDASTDNTYAVAKEYQEKYPDKITLIQNEKNSYLSYSLNHCLQYATGKYVARMDGDDISVPERFENQVKYLQEHIDIQLVGTAMQWFNDKNGPTRIIYKPEHTDKWTLHKEIPFHHATIMTYKTVYDSLNGYTVSERTRRAQDYDLWFRFFAEGYTGDNIHKALYLVREDESAIKRRTFKVRWNAYKTTRIGYRLLGYPKRWLVKAFFVALIKGLTPSFIQKAYRSKREKEI